MTVVVFVGPTLPVADARQILDAVYLPPARSGDVYRAAQHKPLAIGIVDGYFDSTPSVWHKEVLWAMREGIHVFGSASMGALRAAELSAFGMRGVGAVFDAYASGELEDDDEVAIAHASSDMGYQPLSVAMVDIRATLASAEANAIIDADTRAVLVQALKALFYVDRSYRRLLHEAEARMVPVAVLDRLRDWLPVSHVERKRADALEMLHVMAEQHTWAKEAMTVRYHFEHTLFWDRFCQHMEATDQIDDGVTDERVLDEARLQPPLYRAAYEGGVARALATTLASQSGRTVSSTSKAFLRAADDFRRDHELADEVALQAWLVNNDLGLDGLTRLVEDEVITRWATSWATPGLHERMLNGLRRSGVYARLRRRALAKRTALETTGRAQPTLQQIGLTEDQLLDWYVALHGYGASGFAASAASAASADGLARWLGFQTVQALFEALVREYCFVANGKD